MKTISGIVLLFSRVQRWKLGKTGGEADGSSIIGGKEERMERRGEKQKKAEESAQTLKDE